MRVIPPVTITAPMLTSSTIAEPSAGETLWNAATNYVIGTVVARTTTHRLYRNLIAGTDAGLPEATPTRWQDFGPTNRFNMFDTNRTTRSSGASPLTIVLAPGVRFDSLGVCGAVGDSVEITITNGGNTLYANTVALRSRASGSFFSYFFSGFVQKANVVMFGLPINAGNVITITLINASGNAQVGAVILGISQFVGQVQYGAADTVVNYSTVERSSIDGTATFTPRRNVPSNRFSLLVEKQNLNSCRALRDQLNAVVALYVGLEDDGDDYFEALTKLGFARSWSNDIEYFSHYKSEMEIEEL